MPHRRAGWPYGLYYQLTAALALWLAIAVPVACHHAAPQPLFLAHPHDHGGHLHPQAVAGELDRAAVQRDRHGAPVVALHTDSGCAACFPHAGPSASDSLVMPVGALPAEVPIEGLYLTQRLPTLGWPVPATPALPSHDPPPRLLLAV